MKKTIKLPNGIKVNMEWSIKDNEIHARYNNMIFQIYENKMLVFVGDDSRITEMVTIADKNVKSELLDKDLNKLTATEVNGTIGHIVYLYGSENLNELYFNNLGA